VGKKPIGGLYTDDELTTLRNWWDEKTRMVQNRYNSIPNESEKLPIDGLSTIFQEMNKSSPFEIKQIEQALSMRIPSLLTGTKGPRGAQRIVPGGTLAEKLKNLGGGDSIRTIGRIMWSPLCGLTKDSFTNFCLEISKKQIQRGFREEDTLEIYIEKYLAKQSMPNGKIEKTKSLLIQACTLYVEIAPDKVKEPAWSQTLGLTV